MSKERGKSEFSGDVNYLTRLNIICFNCDEASINLDIHSWFHSLMALFREISTEMKNGEIEDFQKKVEGINTLVGSYYDNLNKGRISGVPNDLYNELHNFELDLRRILKTSGLQQKMKESAEFALK